MIAILCFRLSSNPFTHEYIANILGIPYKEYKKMFVRTMFSDVYYKALSEIYSANHENTSTNRSNILYENLICSQSCS